MTERRWLFSAFRPLFSRDGVFPCSFHLTWFHQSEIAQFQDEIRASHFPTPPDQLPRYALLLRM
jgi:hypothetical protein